MSNFLKVCLILASLILSSCGPPPVENPYRKEMRYEGQSFDVPVGFLTSEWHGQVRILASGWLIEGGEGTLMSAKHFSDAFMKDLLDLGPSECKAFLNRKVYSCFAIRVPSVRDAVVLKLLDYGKEPVGAYRISLSKPKIGDKLHIQGFHPHPPEIIESNLKDGFKDVQIPILKNFYELRGKQLKNTGEVVFDNLAATVIKPDPGALINNRLLLPEEKRESLKYENDSYIKVLMDHDHKFSFGGLSGGVALNDSGEAVGVITAQDILRFDSEEKKSKDEHHNFSIITRKNQKFDIIYITPIGSVMDIVNYARLTR